MAKIAGMLRQSTKGLIIMSMVFNACITNDAFAESFSTMQDVHDYIHSVIKNSDPKDILVAYDVDLTLTVFNNPSGHMANIRKHMPIFKQLCSNMSPEDADLMWCKLLQEDGFPLLIEQGTPEMVKKVKDTGAKVIALTAILSGKIGSTPRHEVKRFNELNSLGFHFSFDQLDIDLKNVPAYLNRHPVFYKGVLVSNGSGHDSGTKGPTLIAFLNHIKNSIQWMPKVIIFVDDKEDYLNSVQESLLKHYPSIWFIGIHYTGGLSYESESVTEKEFISFWNRFVPQTNQLSHG